MVGFAVAIAVDVAIPSDRLALAMVKRMRARNVFTGAGEMGGTVFRINRGVEACR